jgi:hypothetical protein
MTLQLSHGFETWQLVHKLWPKVQQSKWGAHWFGDTSNCKVHDQINDEHHNCVAYIKQNFLLRKKEVTHWLGVNWWNTWLMKISKTIQLTKKKFDTPMPLTRLEIVLQYKENKWQHHNLGI